MQLGTLRLARSCSLFALSLLLTCSSEYRLLAQNQAQPASGTPATLPAAQPLSQAATSALPANVERSKPAENDSQHSAVAGEVDSLKIKLGPGDLIEVSVYNVPELSTKARVGNSGDVYLPLVDYVHVDNLSVDEAQALIQKRLEDGGFVRNPHVSVYVDESASQHVTILGEVARPGVYPALSDRRLYDFISAAGGFTPAAGRRVMVMRGQAQTPIALDLPRNPGEDQQDNIKILAGDTISVPKAPIIYVVGDVGRPTGLLVDNGNLTVLQALALAGGTNHTAKMSAVRIIRKGPAGMTETKVPLKKMLEAKAPDINLQADDILFVPLSGARYAAAQGVQAALSAATGIAVIAAHP
jgi:polysaccharide biosynthesis/export protein